MAGALAVGAAALLAFRATKALRQFSLLIDEQRALAHDTARKRRFLEVDGIQTSWCEHGEGPAVILVHGVPTSPELWRDVLPRLTGVRALAWELVGYGLSIDEGKSREIGVAAQADYLARWMDKLGLDNAVLVGHDIGGGVIQQLAVRYPDLCGGILLTNAIGYDSWPIPSVIMLQKTAAVSQHMPMSMFKAVLGSLFLRGHDDREMAAAAFSVHGSRYFAREGAADLVRQVSAFDVADTRDISDQLPNFGKPARIVWGEADQFQTIDYGRRFARDLNVPLRIIPGGRHFTPEDHPNMLAEEIMALVKTVHGESPSTI